MNIFKLSDEDFENYLKENIEKKDKAELLNELIKCGLQINKRKRTRLKHFKKWLYKNHPVIIYYYKEDIK